MQKKFKKLIGLSHDEFENYRTEGQIMAQKARLIPMLKVGDEMALTSIFLSALNYIDEYRKAIFNDIKMSKAGKVYFFTEVCFPDISKHRMDGMILVISAGKVKDVAFLEMKNKNNELNGSQLENYLPIFKTIGADKLITVSNQFVPEPSQLPYEIKKPASIKSYHFSWTYLLTIGHLLLFENETNIEDDDQINIMREVLAYLEHKDSGVAGFSKMKAGWKDVVEKIISKGSLQADDNIVKEAVESWVQEEKDMGLMLSRELGVMVKTSRETKSHNISKDIKNLLKNHQLASRLRVIGSVSDITVQAEFNTRIVSMAVSVDAPLDKGLKGRLGWIKRQIEKCESKYPEVFKKLENDTWIESVIKYSRSNERYKLSDFDKFYEIDKSSEITQFNIIVIRDMGRTFESVKKFVEVLELMMLEFYKGIVQNLVNWDRPAPKLKDIKESA